LKRRVLVLTHQEFQMPEDVEKLDEREVAEWKTEYDVVTALKHLGHETQILGPVTDLPSLRQSLADWKPHIVFNLLEEFRGENFYVSYLLGYFELTHQPFTGCNPSSLLLTDSKALVKKILAYHRIPVPRFAVFPRGRKTKLPRRLAFPLIVKSATEHGSMGIAQASVVASEEKLKERVEFIHESLQTDAIAEEYIEGREFYVGVLGNRRLQTFPVWEIQFENLPERAEPIATDKVKWDLKYQKKIGVKTGPAEDLPEGVAERLFKLSKRIYHILELNGYARMDFRLTPEGKIYLLEPNPNPDLAHDEDFAESAEVAGVQYEDLIQRILNLGLRYQSAR
jgi:D-alanine-D-alanine ligase